jgi:hypothetical protein
MIIRYSFDVLTSSHRDLFRQRIAVWYLIDEDIVDPDNDSSHLVLTFPAIPKPMSSFHYSAARNCDNI